MNVRLVRVPDLLENERIIERKAIEGNIEEQPGHGRAKENLEARPVREEVEVFGPGSLVFVSLIRCGGDGGRIGRVVREGFFRISVLFAVGVDVEGISRSLGHGEAVVEGDAGGDTAEADNYSPYPVNGLQTSISAHLLRSSRLQLTLECLGSYQSHQRRSQLPEALHSKDRGNHSPPMSRKGVFRSNNRAHRIIASNPHPQHHPPERQQPHRTHRRPSRNQTLRQRRSEDNTALNTIHPLPPKRIRQPPKQQLAYDRAYRGGDLDGCIRALGEDLGGVEDEAEHDRDHVDGEEVVGVGEEADAGYGHGADMVPAESCVVELGEGNFAALFGVLRID